MSEEWLNFCGFSRSEIVGETLKILQGEATDRDTTEAITLPALQRESITATLVNYTKRGWPFLHTVHVEPLVGAAGVAAGGFKVCSRGIVSSRDLEDAALMQMKTFNRSSSHRSEPGEREQSGLTPPPG